MNATTRAVVIALSVLLTAGCSTPAPKPPTPTPTVTPTPAVASTGPQVATIAQYVGIVGNPISEMRGSWHDYLTASCDKGLHGTYPPCTDGPDEFGRVAGVIADGLDKAADPTSGLYYIGEPPAAIVGLVANTWEDAKSVVNELDGGDWDTAMVQLMKDFDRWDPYLPAAPTPKPKPTIRDGYVVAVGKDVPAGTYGAHASSVTCYWEIDKHGTDHAIDDDFGHGHIVVHLKAGEDFASQDCGDWTKE